MSRVLFVAWVKTILIKPWPSNEVIASGDDSSPMNYCFISRELDRCNIAGIIQQDILHPFTLVAILLWLS